MTAVSIISLRVFNIWYWWEETHSIDKYTRNSVFGWSSGNCVWLLNRFFSDFCPKILFSSSKLSIVWMTKSIIFVLNFHCSRIYFAMCSKRPADKSVCKTGIQPFEAVFGQGSTWNKCATTRTIDDRSNEYGQRCWSCANKGALCEHLSQRCQ